VNDHPANDPYFYQIYDCIKCDVNSLDLFFDEVNGNWADLTTGYNFLEKTNEQIKKMHSTLKEMAATDPEGTHSVEPEGKLAYIGHLMDPKNKTPITSFLKRMHPFDPKGTPEYDDINGYVKWIEGKANSFQTDLRKAIPLFVENDGRVIRNKDVLRLFEIILREGNYQDKMGNLISKSKLGQSKLRETMHKLKRSTGIGPAQFNSS
jgi:hypothetical protein